MSNYVMDKSLRNAALVAGLGLFVMTIFAISAIYFIFPKLIIVNDASLTATNIIENKTIFRAGIVSLIIVAICDVVVAWAVYVFFSPVNKYLSLLTAWFRLVYSIILLVALLNYTSILQILSKDNYLNSFKTDQLYSLVMLNINDFTSDWAVGLIFFAFHLVMLGSLIIKSDYVPRILGVVLILAGFTYLIDNLCLLILPSVNIHLSNFIGWGELLLMLWFIYRGVESPNKSKQ